MVSDLDEAELFRRYDSYLCQEKLQVNENKSETALKNVEFQFPYFFQARLEQGFICNCKGAKNRIFLIF